MFKRKNNTTKPFCITDIRIPSKSKGSFQPKKEVLANHWSWINMYDHFIFIIRQALWKIKSLLLAMWLNVAGRTKQILLTQCSRFNQAANESTNLLNIK